MTRSRCAPRIRSCARQARCLLDLRLDKSITQDDYDKKARELKEQQAEIALRIEQHQKGDGEYAQRWKA